jgi:uncharacterized 2Fe-2S/4Fe-4S cluster protein (DUF4445 family)
VLPTNLVPAARCLVSVRYRGISNCIEDRKSWMPTTRGVLACATATGLLQLSMELRRAGVIDEDAITRIKDAMASDLLLSRPRHAEREAYETTLRGRLDRLFAGEERLGANDPPDLGSTDA